MAQPQDYGFLTGLVGTAGTLIAAASAIALGWRGRASWEPSEQDLPAGSRKVAGLLSALGVAVLWTLTREGLANQTHISVNDLRSVAIILGTCCACALLMYGFFIAVYTFDGPKLNNGDRIRTIGGTHLTEEARDTIREARIGKRRPRTVQELYESLGYDADRIWWRPGRALIKQLFVLCYILLAASGTIALTSGALLVEVSARPKASREKPLRALPDTAAEREQIRAHIRQLMTEGKRLKEHSEPGEVSAWLTRSEKYVDGTSARAYDESLLPVDLRMAQLRSALDEHERWGAAHLAKDDTIPLHPRCKVWPADLFSELTKHRDDIVIGTIFQNFNNEYLERSVELAALELNSIGGIDGRRVSIAKCTTNEQTGSDDLDPKQAAQAVARYLVDAINVPVIIGADSSGRTQAAYTTVAGTGTLIISPSASSDALIELDSIERKGKLPGLLWRVIAADSVQARVLAAEVKASGLRGIAIAYTDDPYGNSLASAVRRLLTVGGGETYGTALYPFKGPFEMSQAISNVLLQRSRSFALMLISSSAEDYRVFLDRLRIDAIQKGSTDLRVFLPDSAYIRALFEGAAEKDLVLPKLRGTRPISSPSSLFEDFSNRYNNEYALKSPPSKVVDSPYTAHAYDAAWLAFYGMSYCLHRYGGVHGLGAAEGLRHLSASDGRQVRLGPDDWPEAQAEIKAGRSINIVGVSGSLDFDPRTEEATSSVEVWRPAFRSGRWELETVRFLDP